MGKPMATRLLHAGHSLVAWNRTSAKAEALTVHGARIAATPDQAARDAEIVITMLEAGPTVKEVIALATPGLSPGMLVIDMSSTRQSEAQELQAALQAFGVHFIDAPVSGGVAGAEAGTLAIMVGGTFESYSRAKPVLQILGRPTLVGVAGCGQVAKLCNQLIVGATLLTSLRRRCCSHKRPVPIPLRSEMLCEEALRKVGSWRCTVNVCSNATFCLEDRSKVRQRIWKTYLLSLRPQEYDCPLQNWLPRSTAAS